MGFQLRTTNAAVFCVASAVFFAAFAARSAVFFVVPAVCRAFFATAYWRLMACFCCQRESGLEDRCGLSRTVF